MGPGINEAKHRQKLEIKTRCPKVKVIEIDATAVAKLWAKAISSLVFFGVLAVV
jgi:hypothetical protein